MQLRLSFLLLGLASVVLSRPIFKPDTSLSTRSDSSPSWTTSSPSARSLGHFAPALEVREPPDLEDRDYADADDPSPLRSRTIVDPSSEFAENYAAAHSTPHSTLGARTDGLVPSDHPLTRRGLWDSIGNWASKVYHSDAVQSFGKGFKDIWHSVKNTAKGIGQKVKNGYQKANSGPPAGGGGGGMPLERRQVDPYSGSAPSSPISPTPNVPPNPDVNNTGLVKAAENIETKKENFKNKVKSGFKNLGHKFHNAITWPWRKIKQGVQHVKQKIANGAKKMTNSVQSVGKGIEGAATNAVTGAKQGYQEGSGAVGAGAGAGAAGAEGSYGAGTGGAAGGYGAGGGGAPASGAY
ncbi:hypothetical protein F5880DRAFT_726835 [Lentinula raphanica]|nr:hypothetical protein F5880DRAFT_726835 [Lentinula raphanica]